MYSPKFTNTIKICTNWVTVDILFGCFREDLLVACTGYKFHNATWNCYLQESLQIQLKWVG